MSSNPSPTNPPADGGDVFERMAAQRQQIGFALIGLAVALMAIPITNVSLYHWQSRACFIWGTALSLYVLAVGVAYLVVRPATNRRAEADHLRITFLVVLGGIGLITALLGLLLPFSSPPFSMTDYREIFAGGAKKWRERENTWALVRCGAALIGGLVLMFVGLIQARTFERTRPNLRRLLYGYNAVLSSLLLVLIVGLLNVLPYSGVEPFSRANQSIDWTRTGIHTLHPATTNLLAGLKEPVVVYVLGSSGDRVMYETTSLLEKCRVVNPQLNWQQLSPNRNPTAIGELMRKYQLPDSEGVLIVYGTEPKVVTEFIKPNDLFETGGADRNFAFKGESALLNALTFLSAGKTKATVYFTQGNGELAFNEHRATRIDVDVGIGSLIEELNRTNYAARELPVTPSTDKIPEDADIVAIARPRDEMPAKFLSALRDYLKGVNRKDNKKGKLIVLFDVVQRGGKRAMVRTGLEALVAEYGVRVGDNRVLNPSIREDPLILNVMCVERSKNPIAQAFSPESEAPTQFLFYKARTVEATPPNPGVPAENNAENLIITHSRLAFLADTNLDAAAAPYIAELRRNPQKFREMLSQVPLSLAVTVSEGKAPPPIPGHEFMAQEGKPRMVVFGDASWVSNRLLQQATPNNFNLFASSLSWLVERSDIGTRIPPTQHDLYQLKAPPNSGMRLLLLPGLLMMLGVLALGIGVWVVRRR